MKNNQTLHLLGALLLGLVIGAVFYPSKTITKEEVSTFERKIEKLETEKKDIEAEYSMRLTLESRTHRNYKAEVEKKVVSLTQENFQLKSRTKEQKFRIVRPDGTIEEKWFKESETDVVSSIVTEIRTEFKEKVFEISESWRRIHESRLTRVKEKFDKEIKTKDAIISSLKKTEKIEINKRSFGLSLGLDNDKKIISSITYDIVGPIFLDVHLEAERDFGDKKMGLGIGLRF